MSNYTKITDFAAKDALAPGNPAKIITGTAHDNEFNAIATAVNSKADSASPTFTGTVTWGGVSLTVTGTELNYVAGVTSAIQTQLNAKAPTASPTFTGTVTLPSVVATALTASRVVVTNGTGQLAASGATATEAGYLSGVTSAIQTQLNTLSSGKANLSGAAFTGAVSSTSSFTGTDFIISSDARLKQNIVRLRDAGAVVDALNGYRFQYRESGVRSVGFIAQEVQQVLPELVHAREDGYLAVSYAQVVAVLVEEIKDLRARVAAVEAR